MDTLPKELQKDIQLIIKTCPDSKEVFQKLISHFEPLQRKVVNGFNCVISKSKMTKLPSDLHKIKMGKKRELLFTTGKTQHMFSLAEKAVDVKTKEWFVMGEIALMHTGKLYLCDQGIVLYYKNNSFARTVEDLKIVKVTELTTHNCTLSIDGKDCEYYPLDKIELVQNYCKQSGKQFVVPQPQIHEKRVLPKLMEDAENDTAEDSEEDEDFEGEESE